MMKRLFRKPVFWFAVVILVGFGIAALTRPQKTVAETSPAHPDPALVTRYYTADLNTACRFVCEVVPTISTWGRAWRLVEDGSNEEVKCSGEIRAEVPVVIFTDDILITVRESGNKVSVNARSASRIGSDDWGENRRHIIQLFEKLDTKFATGT